MRRHKVVAGVPGGRTAPAVHRLRSVYNVLVPMRDGITLAMDLLRPDCLGRFPVILLRTPYNKAGSLSMRSRPFQEKLAQRGYIVALQDCRGRFNSDGIFDPYRQEHADGFDTVEWLEHQEWCDGNVGMIGGSYNGQTQWFAASQTPKALKAIVPTVSPPGHPFLNEPLWGGIMIMAVAEWMYAMGRRSEQMIGLQGIYTQEQPYFDALPLTNIATATGTSCAWWNEWLSHPTYDEYWKSHGYEQYWPHIGVPALNITGWWDMNFPGAPRNFAGMRERGATPQARQGQRLVIGPWPHAVNQYRSLNGVDFGPQAVTDLDTYTLRFFDHWLRGAHDNGLNDDAPVHVFVIGANEWWESNDWPLPETQFTEFYFHSSGDARSHRGNGTLSRQHPGAEPCDEYESDVLDPVRVAWSMYDGPVDDRAVSARPDLLCYTSEILDRDLDVVGPVRAILFASSSARDCDWHIRLVDVHPNGEARFLCHGALRARFRNGYELAAFLTPGKIERYEIDMAAAGVRFLAGHRIRVEVASSWFSRFERNPQTEVENWMTDPCAPSTAKQMIYHDSHHPSHICLPLIPHE